MGRVININSEGSLWVLEDVAGGEERTGFYISTCWTFFLGTRKVGSQWQDAELDGLQFWHEKAIILLTYVTKTLQKAHFLELTVYTSSVIYTAFVVIPWTGLHSSSCGFVVVCLLTFRNRHVAVPAAIMLEAFQLDGALLLYWLLATGSFLHTLENSPVF